jgi:galactose mutarotase-like enzyme
MITISNKNVSVKISEKGAELQSLLCNGIEYLWQADAAFWPRHSPVLFPIVGELKDGKYIFEGATYSMSRHGFARDKVFIAEQTSGDAAIFTLPADEESLKIYPFNFVFRVAYRLEGSRMFCTYHVENTDDKTMYFSVGGHPAFKAPLTDALRYNDYGLIFNNDEVLKKYELQNGLIGDKTESIPLKNKELQLQQSLFYADAIVLKHINSTQIDLVAKKDLHGLRFTFEGFPFFGIWAAKDAPFVCLEPWCGIADNIHHDHQLVNKEGINQLAPGETWSRTWSVEMLIP